MNAEKEYRIVTLGLALIAFVLSLLPLGLELWCFVAWANGGPANFGVSYAVTFAPPVLGILILSTGIPAYVRSRHDRGFARFLSHVALQLFACYLIFMIIALVVGYRPTIVGV